MPFVVTVRGEDFNTDDLTLAEAERIEAYTGESWLTLNPLRTAKHCVAVMVEVLVRTGVPRDDALAEVGKIPLTTALDHVKYVDPDLPAEYVDGMPDPKAEADGSTSGSSGDPGTPATGPLTSPDGKPSET